MAGGLMLACASNLCNDCGLFCLLDCHLINNMCPIINTEIISLPESSNDEYIQTILKSDILSESDKMYQINYYNKYLINNRDQ